MKTSNRELSTIIKRELKNAFPQCKFSLQVNYYGGTLVVCKAPKSWYTQKLIDNRENYYNVLVGLYHAKNSGLVTDAGVKAYEKIYQIMWKNLNGISGSYYDEMSMDSVKYTPSIYMFGTYSQPLEFIEESSMKGYHTSVPKVNVRRMF